MTWLLRQIWCATFHKRFWEWDAFVTLGRVPYCKKCLVYLWHRGEKR